MRCKYLNIFVATNKQEAGSITNNSRGYQIQEDDGFGGDEVRASKLVALFNSDGVGRSYNSIFGCPLR